MINRIALLAASLVAGLVLAAGLAVAGFGPATPAADAQALDPAIESAAAATDTPAATDPAQVETVYLTPQATPEVIVNTVVDTASAGGDDDGHEENDSEEHEGDDD